MNVLKNNNTSVLNLKKKVGSDRIIRGYNPILSDYIFRISDRIFYPIYENFSDRIGLRINTRIG